MEYERIKGKTAGGISALTLHLLAMGLMLCDHLWATVVPGNDWLTCLGRLAFPVFAFLLAEGYHYTRDVKKYRKRLLIGAVLSEIPFNLMYSGLWIYPFGQNVLWTFLLALLCLSALDRIRGKLRPLLALPLCVLTVAGFVLLGQLAMVDYSGCGVLTVLMFSLLRGRSWWRVLGQAVGLFVINWELMGGMRVPGELFGIAFEIPQQGGRCWR